MSLRTPPLSAAHAEAGATLTEFGGWEMPVEFDSIRTEHGVVRTAVGKFDVSHMSQVTVTGPDATELMDRLTTNDIGALGPGDVQYAAVTDESGHMLDDTVIYRRPEADGYLFVPNAGHDAEMVDRWTAFADRWGLAATVENRTDDYGMVAVQGPEAVDLLAEHCEAPGDVGRFSVAPRTVAGADCLLARAGYTGEDGVELLVDADDVGAVWDALDCQPCGLGARDTLRLEAGFLLSGQDFDPETNPRTPFEAGIDFTVDLGTEFVGREALAAADDPAERLVGLRLRDRGIARHGHEIVAGDGEVVGEVTSGTMSPTLGDAVALGYVPAEHADPGTELAVAVRNSEKRAVVEALPFYER